MRRKALILFLLTMLFNSCSLNNSNLINNSFSEYQSYYKYPEFAEYYMFYNASNYDIFCWQIEPGVWKCGLTVSTSFYDVINVTETSIYHMQNSNPCDLSIMGEILASYPKEMIKVVFIYELEYPSQPGAIKYKTPSNLDYLCGELKINKELVYNYDDR